MLASVLEIACRTNPATREVEPSTSYFQNTLTMNENEAIGSFKALTMNVQMGRMISRSSQAEAMTCRAVVAKLRTGTYTPDATLASAGGVFQVLHVARMLLQGSEVTREF